MIRVQFGVNKHKFIFRDDKIAQAHRESTIFSLKNLQVLISKCGQNFATSACFL